MEMELVDLQHLCLGCMTCLDDPSAPCPVCAWRRDLQNQPHQLAPGSLLAGRYMVGRALGQGGFGITYVAWDTSQMQKVAIKEYYPIDNVTRGRDFYTVTPHTSPEVAKLFIQGRDRFFSEAQNLAKFDSDSNIVSIKDFFYENETAYIVMEFVDGPTLKEYLAALGQPMLLGDILALLAPVVDSLERVHAAGLLHRDISPDNIMITDNGVAKLLDFGAARAFSLQGERSNTVNVKVGYAPKEQFQTHGEQGPWTDVYALAATIYNAVTGVVPASTLDRWQGQDTLQRPTALGISITPLQEAVLLKGMAVEHKHRYQSVRQFYDALIAAGEGKDASSDLIDKAFRFIRNLVGKTTRLLIAGLLYATRKGACIVANLKKCSKGHFFDAEKYGACPYCARTADPGPGSPAAPSPFAGDDPGVTRPVQEQNPSDVRTIKETVAIQKRRKGGLLPWIVAAVATAAMVFCCIQWINYSARYERTMSVAVTRYIEIQGLRSELVEAQEKMEAYSDLEEIYGYGADYYYAEIPVLVLEAGGDAQELPIFYKGDGTITVKCSSSDISAKFSHEWEASRTIVYVTPGSSAGYYTLHFTNDQDDATFEVLVIVK